MTINFTDVEALLGRDFIEAEIARVLRLTDMAEALVESALPGFSIAAGSATDILQPSAPDVVWTSRYPVTAVTSLSIDGGVVPAGLYKWDQRGRIELHSSVYATINSPWIIGGLVTIGFNFGLTPPPADVALTVAAMVATAFRRQATNPDNVLNEQLGAYAVGYGAAEQAAAAVGMTFPDGALRRWKRNRQISVPLVRLR